MTSDNDHKDLLNFFIEFIQILYVLQCIDIDIYITTLSCHTWHFFSGAQERNLKRYKKLYFKSTFNFNISNISHQGYFTDKQSERLYKNKHITNHRKFGLISQREIYIAIADHSTDIYKLSSHVKDKILKK